MSDVFSTVFGGRKSSSGGTNSSSSSSLSENQAFPMLQAGLGGQVANATGASGQMANMLGLNGPQAQNTGFDTWKNSTGYKFGMDQGMQAITGGAASKGLLNSGATGKALAKFGQNYADTQYGNYFNQLLGVNNSGNNAANIIGGAGQKSTSQSESEGQQWSNSKENPGIGKFLGSLMGK